jgi:hypothetical protein
VNKNEELMLIACLCRRPNLERASRLNSDRWVMNYWSKTVLKIGN